MTDEEQYRGFVRETLEKYIKPSEVSFPGMKGVELAKPVRLEWFGATVNPGLYFVIGNQDGEAGELRPHPLYGARRDGLHMAARFDGEEDEQTGKQTDTINGKVRMECLRVKGKEIGIEGMEDVLTLEELTTWAEFGEAMAKGNNALAEKVLRQRYKINDKPIEADEKTLVKRSSLATSPVASMIHNRAFPLKVLGGIEKIPYTDDGEFELTPKNGSSGRVTMRAIPKDCSEFIGNKGANSAGAERILPMIYEILNNPRTPTVDGFVIIPLSKLIRELTRTKNGVNEHATHNDNFRKLVNDCIRALITVRISEHDASDKLVFDGYLLPSAFYKEQVTDDSGNTIKDVWYFAVPSGGRDDFSKHISSGVVKTELLDIPALKPTNYWIPSNLSNIISEIRNNLYPPRGKGKTEYTVKRDWNKFFIAADVVAQGDIRSSVKNRVVRDFEEQLLAYANNLKDDQDKPIFLKAKSTRDAKRGKGKGAFLCLEITGYKKPRKPEINLTD